MPNWCENDLWINGNKKEQEKVLDFISNKTINEDNDYCSKIFDFNKILPYPKNVGIDECDWNNENWGTKWKIGNEAIWLTRQVRNTFLSFDTAYSPPLPIIKILSEKFPKLTFKIKYYESANAFSGERIFKNGKCLKQVDNDMYKGNRGG
jgi:hypothetical protein